MTVPPRQANQERHEERHAVSMHGHGLPSSVR
jgi:hypothetical protein